MTETQFELAALLLVALISAALVTLTVVGERRRRQPWAVALLAGLFFPVAWIAWYMRDERPYRARSRA